jgi:nitrate reductase gamma subunit
MSIGFGIFLVAVGAILAFAVQVSVEWIAVTTVGYILMAAGGVMIVIGAVLMARKRSSVTTQRTQVDPNNGEQVTRRESIASDPVE